jgi:hypothetical protein
MKKETLANDYSHVPLATIQTPTYVGGYRLGGEYGVTFNFTFKPNWYSSYYDEIVLGLGVD